MLILSGSLSAGLKRHARATWPRRASCATPRRSRAGSSPSSRSPSSGIGARARARRRVPRHLRRRHLGLRPRGRPARVGLRRRARPTPCSNRARLGALDESASYAASDLRPDGWVVASQVAARPGRQRARASSSRRAPSTCPSRSCRRSATGSGSRSGSRSRSPGCSASAFSELISRRIRAMSDAAAAMAAGDFEQRLPTGFVPDEVQRPRRFVQPHGGDARRGVRRAPGEPAPDRGGRRVDGRGRRRLRLAGRRARHQPGGGPAARRVPDRDLLGIAGRDRSPTEPAVLEVVRRGLPGESAAETVPLGPVHRAAALHAAARRRRRSTARCSCSPT